jgi:hypothetical protein
MRLWLRLWLRRQHVRFLELWLLPGLRLWGLRRLRLRRVARLRRLGLQRLLRRRRLPLLLWLRLPGLVATLLVLPVIGISGQGAPRAKTP